MALAVVTKVVLEVVYKVVTGVVLAGGIAVVWMLATALAPMPLLAPLIARSNRHWPG